MFWRYSWRDSIPLTITLFQLVLNIWLALTWSERSLNQNLIFLPLCLFLFWYNGLVSSHNFVHTPWFKLDILNRIYAVINSINLGVPQVHYRYEHYAHHRYNNDRQGANGKTLDPTSLFANGQNGEPESFLSYCFLGPFRIDLSEYLVDIKRGRDVDQFIVELMACGFSVVAFFMLSWQYQLCIWLPVMYFGWVLEHVENYYEHFGATPEDRYANSTSYYGRLYNLLFCYEGHHQEHHLRPNVHWTERPRIRQELAPRLAQTNRVILRVPPAFGIFDHQRIRQRYLLGQQLPAFPPSANSSSMPTMNPEASDA